MEFLEREAPQVPWASSLGLGFIVPKGHCGPTVHGRNPELKAKFRGALPLPCVPLQATPGPMAWGDYGFRV